MAPRDGRRLHHPAAAAGVCECAYYTRTAAAVYTIINAPYHCCILWYSTCVALRRLWALGSVLSVRVRYARVSKCCVFAAVRLPSPRSEFPRARTRVHNINIINYYYYYCIHCLQHYSIFFKHLYPFVTVLYRILFTNGLSTITCVK